MRAFWWSCMAMGVGVLVSVPRRLHFIVGVSLVFVGAFGAACTAAFGGPAPPTTHGPSRLATTRPALEFTHEDLLRRWGDTLTSAEAAALVGVLHECHVVLVPTFSWSREVDVLEALELHEAVRLVAIHSAHPSSELAELYRENWQHLRHSTAPDLRARLRREPEVQRLQSYEEF